MELNYLSDIKQALLNNSRVVVELGASWCGPCRSFYPHFVKFAAKHPEFTCVKVDIDVDEAVLSEYPIMSVPQVWLFENNQFAGELHARTVIQLEQELGV